MKPLRNGEMYSKFIGALIEAGGAVTLSRGEHYATGGDSSLHFVPLFEDNEKAVSFASDGWEGMSAREISVSTIESFLNDLIRSKLCVGFFINEVQPPMIFDPKLLYEELKKYHFDGERRA